MTTRTRRRTSLRVGAGISTRRSGLAATEDALGAALAPLDGAIPDLRYMPPDVHKDWYQIVLGGSHWNKGMPGFADPPKFAFPHDKMTVQDADAIHAYVIDGAWKAYKSEQAAVQSQSKENH